MSTIDDPNIVLEILVNHSSYMKNKSLENNQLTKSQLFQSQ